MENTKFELKGLAGKTTQARGIANGPAQQSFRAQRRSAAGTQPSAAHNEPKPVCIYSCAIRRGSDGYSSSSSSTARRREVTLAAAEVGGRGTNQTLAELGDDGVRCRRGRGSRGKQRRRLRCTAAAPPPCSAPAGSGSKFRRGRGECGRGSG